MQNYKDGYEKAKKKRDKVVKRKDEAQDETIDILRNYKDKQGELLSVQQMLKKVNRERDGLLAHRKEVNNARITCFRTLLEYQTSPIAELDKLVRQFKNVAVPKVKGVGASKSSTNTPTAPLERFATALNNAQLVTQSKLALATNIEELLASAMKDGNV